MHLPDTPSGRTGPATPGLVLRNEEGISAPFFATAPRKYANDVQEVRLAERDYGC